MLVVVVVVVGYSAQSAAAATCSDYATQAEAQRAADTTDADGDGIYCESLPCPCLKPGAPPPAAPPPAPGNAPDEAAPESRSDSAERFIRRYYFLLNQRRFSTAWAKFSPNLRRRFAPYGSWRAGSARTVGTRVNSASVSLAGSRAVVRVAIRARDRDACNGRVVRQFFRVRWVLAPRGGSWVATNVTARRVGGGTVRLQRSQCAPARRPSDPSPPPPPPNTGGGRSCDPIYSGCLNPNASDYDCRGGGGDGPLYTGPVIVKGDDHYRLDADGDGVGCEA